MEATNEASVSTNELSNQFGDVKWDEAPAETYTTRKFSVMEPGNYIVTPMRRIKTTYGNQLIVQCCQGEDEFETFVPNSYILALKKTCGDVTRIHALKYIGMKKNGKGQPVYDFKLGIYKNNEKVAIDIPVSEQSW